MRLSLNKHASGGRGGNDGGGGAVIFLGVAVAVVLLSQSETVRSRVAQLTGSHSTARLKRPAVSQYNRVHTSER